MTVLKNNILLFALLIFISSCNESANLGTIPSVDDDEEEIEDSVVNPPIEVDPDAKIYWPNWYLSVPIDAGSGKATSIGYQTIVNNQLTDEESEYFYQNDDGSYTMWTKFTGFTTSGYSELGNKFCRTELREYWRGNQDVRDNWSMSTGVHTLETTMKVDFVEGNGRTIVAQIHGKESPGIDGNPATVKIRWNSGIIQIDHYTRPDSGEPWTSQFDE